MKKNIIITISRQFGSNGREIGRLLAEYLDIGYYNKEIMESIAQDLGIDADFFREENRNDQGLYALPGHHALSTITELSINSEIYEKASHMIQGIAQRESAVIVGRCADYILREHDETIRLFIYSNLEDRLHRSVEEYKVPLKKAKRFVREMDEKRAGFYEFYTNQKWGSSANYDMMINTSYMTADEIVQMISQLYDTKMGMRTLKGGYVGQYDVHKNVSFENVEQ